MATRTSAARPAAIIVRQPVKPVARRSTRSPKLEKLEKRLAAVARRTRDSAADAELDLITVGTPLAFGLAKSRGVKLPTIAGYPGEIVVGGLAALFGKRALGGKNGARVKAAGVGLLASIAGKVGEQGTLKVAGDDDEIGADDDEIAGDDDDD